MCSTDNMKYALMNILEKQVDRDSSINARRNNYQQLFRLIRDNSFSTIQAQNLYALVYSKFFTIRYMVQQANIGEAEFFRAERDVALKNEFKKLVQRVMQHQVNDDKEFQQEFLTIITAGRSERATQAFNKMSEVIDSSSHEAEWQRFKAEFWTGSSQTSAHLQKKLSSDLNLFKTRFEKTSDILNKYRFLNGWITAGGVAVFGTIMTYFHVTK